MTAYKYYAAERARYADLQQAHLGRQKTVDLVNSLCDYFGRPRLPILFSDGYDVTGTRKVSRKRRNNWSFFSTGASEAAKKVRAERNAMRRSNGLRALSPLKERCFSFGNTMLQARTAAHEVAHYLHFMEYEDLGAKWRPGTGSLKPRITQWHGSEHEAWMARCVEATVKLGYGPKPTVVVKPHAEVPVVNFTVTFTKVEGEIVETPKDPVAAFFDSLPPLLTCPCCNATLPKMNFGVRVMKRDANNVPTVIRRQSYCRACR